MDGLTSDTSGASVVVIAACNTPWDLDDALRRRLEKRIHVPLPDAAAREAMFRRHLHSIPCADDMPIPAFAAATHGYSGADLRCVCREAAMAPVRRLLGDAHSAQQLLRSSASDALTSPLACVCPGDVRAAIERTKPSVTREDAAAHTAWELKFGVL